VTWINGRGRPRGGEGFSQERRKGRHFDCLREVRGRIAQYTTEHRRTLKEGGVTSAGEGRGPKRNYVKIPAIKSVKITGKKDGSQEERRISEGKKEEKSHSNKRKGTAVKEEEYESKVQFCYDKHQTLAMKRGGGILPLVKGGSSDRSKKGREGLLNPWVWD